MLTHTPYFGFQEAGREGFFFPWYYPDTSTLIQLITKIFLLKVIRY